LIALRGEVIDQMRHMTPRLASVIGLATVPPAVIGYLLEKPIERRLGTARTIAVGLIVGGAAMAWADTRQQFIEEADAERGRTHDQATARDGLILGLGQATALFPGVSRNGSTLTAARLRGFRRADAERLSRHVALPVIGGATLLKTVRLAQRGLPDGSAGPLALGVAASFVSTLASTRLIKLMEQDRPLWPISAYRVAVGTATLRKLKRS